jgi:ABC-type sugar transport system permease subunit
MSSTQTSYRRSEALTGAVFLLPGVGIIFVCVFIPILLAFGLSFTHCSRFLTVRWAGLYNYQKLFTDPLALKSLLNTLTYVVTFVPLNLALALGIALLLNRRFKSMPLIRSVYFVPVVLSMVVTVSIFRFMYDFSYGPLNAVLGTIGFEPISYLEDQSYAMGAIIAMALWKSSAFFSIILLAALQDVPRSLHEAAMVDGAGVFTRFRHVTIPSILPVMTAILALSSIGAFRVFVPMFVLTQGGPAFSTRTMALHAYSTGFDEGNLGQSSAVSFALLAIILAATLLLNRARRTSE